jgi:hypothetical protein
MKASEEKGGKIERRVRRDRSAEDAEQTNGKDARPASRDGRYKVKIKFHG